jgi:replicative DNA helicase
MQPLERTILRQLFDKKDFAERVVPYLKEEYFFTPGAATIYRLYHAFFEKFHAVPQFAAIKIGLDSVKTLTEREAKEALTDLAEVEAEVPLSHDQDPWLLEQAEEFCQDRALHVGLQECIRLMDDPNKTRHAIPDVMKSALAVSFDNHIGHDLVNDADARYEFYHKPETKLPFDLEVFNAMTRGGVTKKTLNVVMAGTNVGKSLFLVHQAATYLRLGKNVLYITMEMAEERIAERVDANLMNLPIDDVHDLPHTDYIRKIHTIRSMTTGRLIIKEYPTGQAHCGHFRALLHELKLKQNFVPDVIMIDYITICASSRIKMGTTVNSFSLYKFVAEELRGLGVEFGVPIWSAAQFNREGYSSSDPGLENVGESWGIPQTADFMFALVSTEDLAKLGQLAVVEMKNRYAKKKTFGQQLVGVDTDRMKLYDLTSAQLASSVNPPPSTMNSPSATFQTFNKRKRRPLQALRKQGVAQDDE